MQNNKKNPTIDILKRISKQLNIPFGIISFLSVENEEVEEDKRKAFDIMVPAVKAMIKELFLEE